MLSFIELSEQTINKPLVNPSSENLSASRFF